MPTGVLCHIRKSIDESLPACHGTSMEGFPQELLGLSEIAGDYDALVCDVWGVLHDGRAAHARAVEALRRFRSAYGPVILLSNAPRPVRDLEAQFARIGVPLDCYDAIVTSGVATREALAERAQRATLPILHIGPDRDRGVFEGLPVVCVPLERADVVLCTGLFDDDVETPEDYREQLSAIKARGLVLLCANPDLVVQRGGKLVWCAGAIAREYEKMGGEAIYYGKPHRPIYDAVSKAANSAAGRSIVNPLAIGDGLETDIAGANGVGFDALFIADGIHGENLKEFSQDAAKRLFDAHHVRAKAVMRSLVW